MSLIVLIGAQAVGKMTVGKALEATGAGRLLFNHETIDIFARFLGYGEATFNLSDQTRKSLFKAFVGNTATNVTPAIIFTVMINFDDADDRQFLTDISDIFIAANQPVYFVELTAPLSVRIDRNIMPDRLAAKPSKRDIQHSQAELLQSNTAFRLSSRPDELALSFPNVRSCRVDTAAHTARESAAIIQQFIRNN